MQRTSSVTGTEDQVSEIAGSRRRARRTDRTRSRVRRRILLVAALTALILVGAATVWAGFTYLDLVQRIKPPSEDAEAIAAALTARDEISVGKNPVWILLLGSDARPGDTDARADTIILARLDTVAGTVDMLSIPRDTRVEIPGHGSNKINAATAFGGTALMIQTVKQFTGLPVDHFLKIDFQGFKDGVDAMGGIVIDVESPIDDLKAADYVRSASQIDAGKQLLDGAQALTFVRSRAYPDGDFTRMRNQQRFLVEFTRQAVGTGNIMQLPAVASAVAQHLDTDMSIGRLLDLGQLLNGIAPEDMRGYTVPASTGNIGGVSYVLHDEEALEKLVAALEAGEVPSEEGDGVGGNSEVVVVNASEVQRAAARFAGRLEREGIAVDRVQSDTTLASVGTAVVYGKDQHAETARLIAELLGGWPVVQDRSVATSRGDIVVIVGPGTARALNGQVLER